MRIVTFDTLRAGVMLRRVYAGDALAFACRVGEIGMTTQTEFAATINHQLFRCLGMFERRSVTIFTGDDAMKFLGTHLNHFPMTLTAVLVHFLLAGNAIFCRLILPFHLV